VNVLFVSVDSLRRDFLTTYAEQPAVVDYDVDTDNLDRFAERATVFDTHYAGSLPCMPARREWLTGTKEFLWRPWGPTEPFDAHIAEVARDRGILTKLITDHFHYFQHGSHGYYEDFNGFDFVRGNEYDAWKTAPLDPGRKRTDRFLDRRTDPPESVQYLNRTAYARNSFDFDSEADYFTSKVFSRAVDWLDANQEWDQWFCYIDNFDVHEPFDVPEPYASMYTDEDPYDPELPLWPYYGPVDEGQSELTDRELRFVRSQFAGNVTMVDRWLGELLRERPVGRDDGRGDFRSRLRSRRPRIHRQKRLSPVRRDRTDAASRVASRGHRRTGLRADHGRRPVRNLARRDEYRRRADETQSLPRAADRRKSFLPMYPWSPRAKP